MKKAVYLVSIVLFVCMSALAANAINITKFEYTRQIKPDCSEFIGYSEVAVDNNLLTKSNGLNNLYIDSEYFINYGADAITANWYVKDSNIGKIDDLKSFLDNNPDSYYTIEKPNNELVLELKNTNTAAFDKIKIQLKDSELKNIKFYGANENELSFSSIKEGFAYTYILDKKSSADLIKIRIFFENVLKISEIQIINHEQDRIYFFINNDCSKMRNMYYGNYGGKETSYAKHDLTKKVQSKLTEEKQNPAYNPDFDSDSISNKNDNCVYAANAAQEDLNYNGVGDSCEDFDNDSILNLNDNCKEVFNPGQQDIDKDDLGDACDATDDRYSEKNKWLFYVLGIVVVLLFVFISYNLLKKKYSEGNK